MHFYDFIRQKAYKAIDGVAIFPKGALYDPFSATIIFAHMNIAETTIYRARQVSNPLGNILYLW